MIRFIRKKVSNIQLPYGYFKNNKQIQFNLPKNYAKSEYIKRLSYITNKGPVVENNILNVWKNRDDLKKWLLATSDSGNEIQEDLNAVVGYDEKFNNAIVRHALDLENEAIFRSPNSLNVAFCDVKKFDAVNPVIGKLATQVKASKLTDYELTKKILGQGETDKLQNIFDLFRGLGVDDSDDDENTRKIGSRGGGGGRDDSTLPRLPSDLYGGNSPQENLRHVAQANEERFQNRILRDREGEISTIPWGIVKPRRSSFNINLPETPPPTPFEYIPQPPSTPRETCFFIFWVIITFAK